MNIKTALTVSVLLNLVLIYIVYKDDKLLAIKEAVKKKQESLRNKQPSDQISKLLDLDEKVKIDDYYDDNTSKTNGGDEQKK